MTCPVCKAHENVEIGLHAEGFSEEILECRFCGAIWSVNHGMAEVVNDPQAKSFLSALSENVEADDYAWVA